MKEPSTERRYWLFKSEPESFSFDDLLRAPRRRATWDGVRNYQARNSLRDAVQVGDGVLFYHSSANPPGVAGMARVVSGASVDPTQFDPSDEHFDPKSERASPRWVQVEIEAASKLPRFVALDDLRSARALAGMLVLQRGQRLSIQPVTAPEWSTVLKLGGLDPAEFEGAARPAR